MTIPAVIFVVLFSYLPMVGILVAFQNYNVFQGVFHSPWVGFQNFQYFFSNPIAWQGFRNTLVLGLLSLLFGFPAPIIFALLLNELTGKRFRKFVQSVSYLPYFISVVIMVGILKDLAAPQGLFNGIAHWFGVQTIQFFADPGWFRPLFVGSGIWQTLGWSSILYLAALTGIDPELYAAAKIDGAGRWKQTLHITLPGLSPTIMILLILSIGSILNTDYQKVLLMQSPSNLETSNVIGTYVYQVGIQNAQFSEAAAIGLALSVVAFILVIGANWAAKKWTEQSLW